MLRLYRSHIRYEHVFSELDCSEGDVAETVLEWAVGNFKNLEDVLNYLYFTHKYRKLNKSDKEDIINTIERTGHSYIPCTIEEETDDGCKVIFYVEKF